MDARYAAISCADGAAVLVWVWQGQVKVRYVADAAEAGLEDQDDVAWLHDVADAWPPDVQAAAALYAAGVMLADLIAHGPR